MKKLPKMAKLPTSAPRRKAPSPSSKQSKGSNVEGHSYSAETGQLTVTYRGGRSYRYDGVDPKTAEALEKSGSKGAFLHGSIIGKFSATKI